VGHDVASHTHEPLGPHSWPCAQATHAAPVAPHDVFLDVWHAPASSQQPVHPVPPQEHAWLAQAWPTAHVTHCAPPLPHAPGEVPRAHTPLESQQPVGQLSGPQAPLSRAASVASSEPSVAFVGASTVASSPEPASDASSAGGVEFESIVASGGPLASPEWSSGGGARQPASTNDRTNATTPSKRLNVLSERSIRTPLASYMSS